jgi:HlyD family secretion protein
MQKWIIFLLVVALLVGGGWFIAQKFTMVPLGMQPKVDKVKRGNLRVPVSAAGLIHAQEVIEVKSMASGRITKVAAVEGDYVDANQPVVILDPIDEQRALDRATADLQRAQALLEQATIAIDKTDNAVETAKANFEETKQRGRILKFNYDKVKELVEKGQTFSQQELNDADAQYKMNLAQQKAAQVAIRSAELAKQDAQAAVKSQEAVVDSASKTKEDAEKRLRETTVRAPRAAIVTEVMVRPGMLVQSAIGSFVGGTLLMKIADVSVKKVIARVDEADYGRVLEVTPVPALPDLPGLREAAEQDSEQMAKRGGPVKITVDTFPELEFEGRIYRVEPQGKLNQGSSIIQYDVHVEITDEKRYLLPLGAQAQVEFTVQSAEDVLLVPAEAVKSHEDQRGVWVKVDPPPPGEKWGKRFVPCRFGISDGELTQVVGETELKPDVEVYTKLPVDAEEAGGRR